MSMSAAVGATTAVTVFNVEYAIEPMCKGIEESRRSESAKDIDEVMRLNVNRRSAQQHEERRKYIEYTAEMAPEEHHKYRAHTNVARRERRNGTLAAVVGNLHKALEQSVGTDSGTEFGVRAEIVLKHRIMSV